MIVGTVTSSRAAAVESRRKHLRLSVVPTQLWIVVVAALVVRVAWVCYAAREPAEIADPYIYLFLARRLANGWGYGPFFAPGPSAFHPIGYPGALAGIVLIARAVGLEGHVPLLVGLFQAMLGTACVALVYGIASRLFDRRVALVASALAALFPNLVMYSAVAYSENLYTFGVLLALWLLVREQWSPGPRRRALVAFGVVVGLTSLVRPFTLLFPFLLAVALLRVSGIVQTAAQAAKSISEAMAPP